MKEVVAELSQLARPVVGGEPALGRERTGHDREPRDAGRGGAEAGGPPGRAGRGTADQRPSGGRGVDGGKIELETLGDETREDRVVEKLVARAVVNVFNRHFALSSSCRSSSASTTRGWRSRSGSPAVPSHEELAAPGAELRSAIARLDAGESPAGIASATEFVLEGLHLNRRLNKERRGGRIRWRALTVTASRRLEAARPVTGRFAGVGA